MRRVDFEGLVQTCYIEALPSVSQLGMEEPAKTVEGSSTGGCKNVYVRRVDFEGLDQTCCIEALPTVSLFTNKVFLEYFLCHNWQYILDERIYSELFSEVRHCTTLLW